MRHAIIKRQLEQEKDDVGGQVSSWPSPLRGAAQWPTTNAVTQDQVSDHPSKATNTSRASQGGHDHCAVKREKRRRHNQAWSALHRNVQ